MAVAAHSYGSSMPLYLLAASLVLGGAPCDSSSPHMHSPPTPGFSDRLLPLRPPPRPGSTVLRGGGPARPRHSSPGVSAGNGAAIGAERVSTSAGTPGSRRRRRRFT